MLLELRGWRAAEGFGLFGLFVLYIANVLTCHPAFWPAFRANILNILHSALPQPGTMLDARAGQLSRAGSRARASVGVAAPALPLATRRPQSG